jgi:hypothetical protein
VTLDGVIHWLWHNERDRQDFAQAMAQAHADARGRDSWDDIVLEALRKLAEAER